MDSDADSAARKQLLSRFPDPHPSVAGEPFQHTCARFLRASAGDVDLAHANLAAHLAWRDANVIDLSEDSLHKCLPCMQKGFDAKGRPLIWIRAGALDADRVRSAGGHAFMRYQIFLREASLQRASTATHIPYYTTVLDLRDVRLLSSNSEEIKRLIKDLVDIETKHYPHRNSALYIINAPFFFGALWRYARSACDFDASRVRVVGSKDEVVKASLLRIMSENTYQECYVAHPFWRASSYFCETLHSTTPVVARAVAESTVVAPLHEPTTHSRAPSGVRSGLLTASHETASKIRDILSSPPPNNELEHRSLLKWALRTLETNYTETERCEFAVRAGLLERVAQERVHAQELSSELGAISKMERCRDRLSELRNKLDGTSRALRLARDHMDADREEQARRERARNEEMACLLKENARLRRAVSVVLGESRLEACLGRAVVLRRHERPSTKDDIL